MQTRVVKVPDYRILTALLFFFLYLGLRHTRPTRSTDASRLMSAAARVLLNLFFFFFLSFFTRRAFHAKAGKSRAVVAGGIEALWGGTKRARLI